MYLNWTPTRDLVSGVGSDGKLEVGISQFDRKIRTTAKEAVSLGGNRERVFQRNEVTYDITIPPTRGTTVRDKMRELAASVAAGETFTLDAFGTELSPDDPLTVTMVLNSYTESYQGDSIFTYRFRIYV